MYKRILDRKEADLLWQEGILYVSNEGRSNWRLDNTNTLPSLSWMYWYAVLLED